MNRLKYAIIKYTDGTYLQVGMCGHFRVSIESATLLALIVAQTISGCMPGSQVIELFGPETIGFRS